MIGATSTITRSTEPVETTVGTEVVLMSLATGECYGLGETGSDVWRLLTLPITVAEVTAQLRAMYEAPVGVLEGDVVELLEDLAGRGLVVVS